MFVCSLSLAISVKLMKDGVKYNRGLSRALKHQAELNVFMLMCSDRP